MFRQQVLVLYKSKIKCCRKLGYKYGDWDNDALCDYRIITKRKIRRLYKKQTLGHVLFNNIRFQYKVNKKEKDDIYLSNVINYAYYIMRYLNKITYHYVK